MLYMICLNSPLNRINKSLAEVLLKKLSLINFIIDKDSVIKKASNLLEKRLKNLKKKDHITFYLVMKKVAGIWPVFILLLLVN